MADTTTDNAPAGGAWVLPLRSLGTILSESGKVVLAVADAAEAFLGRIAPGVQAVLSAGHSLADWARRLTRSKKAADAAADADAFAVARQLGGGP